MPRPPKRDSGEHRRDRRDGSARKGTVHPSRPLQPQRPAPGRLRRGTPDSEASPSAPTEILSRDRVAAIKRIAAPTPRPAAPTSRPAPAPKQVPLTKEQIKVGIVLMAEGPITSDLVRREIEEAGMQNSLLAKAVAASGHVAEPELITLLLTGYRIPKVKLANYRLPREAFAALPAHLARKYKLVPLGKIGSILCVAVGNIFEFDINAIKEVRRETGFLLKIFQSTFQEVEAAVRKLYPAPEKLEVAAAVSVPEKREVVAAVPVGPEAAPDMAPEGIPYEDTAKYWEKMYASAGPVKAVMIED